MPTKDICPATLIIATMFCAKVKMYSAKKFREVFLTAGEESEAGGLYSCFIPHEPYHYSEQLEESIAILYAGSMSNFGDGNLIVRDNIISDSGYGCAKFHEFTSDDRHTISAIGQNLRSAEEKY